MSILSVKGLKKYYGDGENVVRAIDGMDIEISKGEFVAVVGSSGSGKTTLLNMLGGLDNPTEGKIVIAGKELDELNDTEKTIFRRRNIGFVFQNYNLVPILNVYENVVLPLELDGKIPESKYLNAILKVLKIDEKKECMPGQLSGGQQQRVAIARALITKPSILLADEPTGNLDSKTTDNVMKTLKLLSVKLHQTVVMITHDEHIANMADRILRINDGKIVKDEVIR